MLIGSEVCDGCTRCAACERRVCFEDQPSPGEADGLCADCWLVEDDTTVEEVPC